MEELLNWVQTLVPENFNYESFYTALILLTVGTIVLGLIGRYAFGKKSVLHGSVSSVIGILFIYALVVVLHSTGVQLGFVLSPLPFIQLDGDYLHLFAIAGKDYVTICGELLNMIILAFAVNAIDRVLPTGKKLIGWFIYRCLSVVLGVLVFTLLMALVNHFLPEGLLTWAPVILLGLLVLSLLLGALKVVVGAVLTTINPLLAVFYTFFFASILGKMVSKAMLTTLIMAGLVYALNYFGILTLYIGTAMLTAYIPLLIVLLVLWYVIGKLMAK